MDDQDQSYLEDLINFFKDEKDIYGDFSVESSSSSEPKVEKTEEKSASNAETKNESKQHSEPVHLSAEEKINQCTTLEELRVLCEQAEELKTDLDNTNLVFGVGNESADLMIIGEAPGEQEDKKGEPFVGPAGQLLDKILEAINFSRDDVYIANILKHRPPDNRNPNSEEIERSLPYLMRQIDLIDPKIILCLGKISALSLLGKDDALKNIRGKFFNFRQCELTATYHPAALLRNPKWKRPTWEDVQLVRKRYDELGGTP